ncbi:MAG: hypothetical protein QOJ98_2408 [Acidobacteriota bacterium]|jgi:PKD repeat protein|nr:hypothetical protein [Acidobacteriota bacterium]
MIPKRFALVLALWMFASACGKDGNPVALPTDPNDGTAFTLGITSDANPLEARSSAPVTLTIIARKSDGTAPPNGTEVNLNTTLGNFGIDGDGKPIQLVTRTLVNGMATAQFYAGSEPGTAKVLAQSGTTVGSLNLSIVEPPPLPVADFTFATSALSVLFTNASTNATNYQWTFGDGGSSTAVNPSHIYAAAGSYTATLVAKNSAGEATKHKFVELSLGSAPTPVFTFGINGRQVNFVDKSTGNPTSWLWDFGDGSTEDDRNPVHVYAAAGQYTVMLTVSNAAGSNSASDVVKLEADPVPVAKFTATIDGKQVNFVDQSTGNPTRWSWEFGDGASSGAQHPVHTYAAAGTYTVTLTVINDAGSNETSQAVKIEAAPPVAKFKCEVAGFQATCADQSTGNPASWLWEFGDGDTSTEQNPVHTYSVAGNYTVKLTVTNADGSNSASDVVKVEAGEKPTADFTFTVSGRTVNFVDRSTGEPTSWAWNFGDSTPTVRQQNPVHTYENDGTYTVRLTATNANGSNNVAYVVQIPPPE